MKRVLIVVALLLLGAAPAVPCSLQYGCLPCVHHAHPGCF